MKKGVVIGVIIIVLVISVLLLYLNVKKCSCPVFDIKDCESGIMLSETIRPNFYCFSKSNCDVCGDICKIEYLNMKGPCSTQFSGYYYDSDKGCTLFSGSGCTGPSFETLEECQEKCK